MAGTGHDYQQRPAAIKLGLDIHQARHVVVAQEGHSTPRPARRFLPHEFVPWVETLLARGHAVFGSPILLPPLVPGAAASVVYEACGFGFGLCRRLTSAGAACYVIAPQKLDEARKGVKTDRGGGGD